MNIAPLKGKYVQAVSGGVDSVVLLELLNNQRLKNGRLDLVVAHFDHGIRENSAADQEFVKDLASQKGLKYHFAKGHLGKGASEEQARNARYEFLNGVIKKEKADGLIIAHHQDDVIETAIINIIRGTGRRGLSSLGSSTKVMRPLLGLPKSEIINYAKHNKLTWQEDITNQDPKYLRNYVRLSIVPRLDEAARARLIELINRQAELNAEIDKQLAGILKAKAPSDRLPRLWLSSLDGLLSQEVLAAWLRQNGLRTYDRATIERLSANLKTSHPNKQIDVLSGWQVTTSMEDLALDRVER